jgi:putative ABC transport system substrate-binding protein
VKKTAVTCIVIAVMLQTFTVMAQAQQPGKIFRIGYLDPTTVSGSAANLETFRQELSKLGWIEGKNLVFEYRFAEGKPGRSPELAAELVRLKVDLIVTTGNPPALAAQKATSTIPIVMTGVVDPVAIGLVASLARPGGNVTGFGSLAEQLITKRLEVLKDAVPKLDRVGLLKLSTSNPGEELQLKELRVAALALKVKLEEIETQRDAKGLEIAFQTAKQKQVKAIMMPALRFFSTERKRIVELAVKYRLPAIHFQKGFVDEGGLMSYGPDNTDLYSRVAGYVDKILKGAKPADLPVQQAMKFEFVINLKAAKQINLIIPPEVLARANKVIK